MFELKPNLCKINPILFFNFVHFFFYFMTPKTLFIQQQQNKNKTNTPDNIHLHNNNNNNTIVCRGSVPELAGRFHADLQPDLHHVADRTLVRMSPVPRPNAARLSSKLLGLHQWIAGVWFCHFKKSYIFSLSLFFSLPLPLWKLCLPSLPTWRTSLSESSTWSAWWRWSATGPPVSCSWCRCSISFQTTPGWLSTNCR